MNGRLKEMFEELKLHILLE